MTTWTSAGPGRRIEADDYSIQPFRLAQQPKIAANSGAAALTLAVVIVSPHDRTRKKIPFYEKVGTRELLIVDRRPWRLTLLRLVSAKLQAVGESTFDDPRELASQVVPLTFRLVGDASRPAIHVQHHDGVRHWTVEALPPPRKTE